MLGPSCAASRPASAAQCRAAACTPKLWGCRRRRRRQVRGVQALLQLQHVAPTAEAALIAICSLAGESGQLVWCGRPGVQAVCGGERSAACTRFPGSNCDPLAVEIGCGAFHGHFGRASLAPPLLPWRVCTCMVVPWWLLVGPFKASNVYISLISMHSIANSWGRGKAQSMHTSNAYCTRHQTGRQSAAQRHTSEFGEKAV